MHVLSPKDALTSPSPVTGVGEVGLVASHVQNDTWPKSLRQLLNVIDGFIMMLDMLICLCQFGADESAYELYPL